MNTWKKLTVIGGSAALLFGLTACGGSDDSADGSTKLVIGASPSPHAVILNYVKDNLAEAAGLDLEIKEYTDYVQPNEALASGDLDANYFQTIPYLQQVSEEKGYDFESGEGIHLEPLGVYSEKITDISELPESGATIGIINDVTNQSRALKLLLENGLIFLPTDESEWNVATIKDSEEYNPRKFVFQELEGPQLVRSLEDVDIAVINGNYALDGGKKPSDAVLLESAQDNPSLNVLVWAADSSKKTAIKKLDELLHSDEVRQFIEEEYPDKSVIPGF